MRGEGVVGKMSGGLCARHVVVGATWHVRMVEQGQVLATCVTFVGSKRVRAVDAIIVL